MCRFGLIAVCVLFCVCPAALGIDVDNPPMGTFSDEWYAVMLGGQKSGHMHSVMERRKSGSEDVVRTLTETTVSVGRADSSVSVTMKQESEETLAGKPLSFSQTMTLGFIPTTTRGTFRDGKVTITSTQFGRPGEPKTYTLPEGAMMSWAVYREQFKRGLKPGTRYTVPLYDPSISPDRLTDAVVEIGDKESIDLFGRKVEAIRSRQTVTIKSLLGDTPIETITWLTENGDPIRLEMTLLNTPVEIIACPKPVALAANNPVDLMEKTLIPVDKPIDPSVREIGYRLRWHKNSSGPATRPSLPDTDMQRVQRTGRDELLVTVRRHQAAGPASTQPAPLSAEDRKLYLAASTTLDYNDPEVARLAEQAAADEKDPRKLADRLRKFVGDYIEAKNLSVGFATAGEVARSKEGDCTEHGVLLAALGRAAGIPTRLVMGLVYIGASEAQAIAASKHGLFIGHMWTQFWIDGRWVDLDAALGQTEVDPTHIALGLSAGSESGLADMVSSLWLSIGHISIDVVKSE